MSRERITIPNVGEPAIPAMASQCLKVGNQVFISGQIAYDNGELVGLADPLEQSRQCFRHIKSYMEAAGGTIEDVVSLNIFLADIRYRQASMDARAEFFGDPGPTATVVGGADFVYETILIEVSAIGIIS